MNSALSKIKIAVKGSKFESDLYLVGGAVRDELLGLPHSADFDLVTTGDSSVLAGLLRPISSIAPVTYVRFGTAMLVIDDTDVELVTARTESYDFESRKPSVEPATLEEDAARRDFTVNTLMRSLESWELIDPTGRGIADLNNRILRTPLDPAATFFDDPLRMMRAVRFRWKLGFTPADGLYDAIRKSRDRLRIVSSERIRDELIKMLGQESAPDALQDLLDLGLLELFAPEFLPMVGCEQGKFHHLDVWKHSLLVLKNAGPKDLILSLSALLHDIGKPPTRTIDASGNTRFFGHEGVGEKIAQTMLRRLKFPQKQVDQVAALVGNHMRLGSAPVFTATAARRLLRDLGDQTERLLQLVTADINGLKVGVAKMDLDAIRSRIEEVQLATPPDRLQSPLSGNEIMTLTGLPPGLEVGRIKNLLTEKVLEGELHVGDTDTARELVLSWADAATA